MSHTIQPLLEDELLRQLRDAVRGEILTPDDAGYEEASKIWNGAHDGYRPAVTASPASRPSTAGSSSISAR